MNQKGIAPVLIIILIALGIGGYLVQSKHTRFKQEPTATPTNNETAQQSGSNDQQKISDKFTYQDIQRTQTGPTHYFCYPDEITSQQNNNLIGFNCSRQDENMNCQLSNSKTLIKTATSEFVNIHYKCERGNAYGEPGGYICRNELPAFRRSVLIELEKFIHFSILDQHHQTENYFRFKNGSMLFYGGLGDSISGLQRLSSMTLGFFAVDQAEETSETHFNMLAGRLRLNISGIRYKGLLTCNPAPGWVKQKFVEQKLDDHVFIQSLPKDNPFLPSDYESGLRKIYPAEWVKSMLEGDWNALESGNFLIQYKYLRAAVNREI